MTLYLVKFTYSLFCYARSTTLLSRTNKLILQLLESGFHMIATIAEPFFIDQSYHSNDTCMETGL